METPPNRILHVPRRFSAREWGGTEAVVSHLCQAQLAQGWQPEIHTSMALDPKPYELFGNIPVHRYRYCYPFLGLSAQARQQLDKKGGNLLSWPLYRALRQAKDVRIFHAHVTKRTGASVLKAARLAHRPCVVTLHGNMFDVPTCEAQELIAPQQGKFEWGRAFGAYFGSRRMLEQVDAVLCVGFSEYEQAQAALGADKVHFLPNGVQPEQFQCPPAAAQAQRLALGFGPDDFVFGCISRIDPQKDQCLLVEAFSRLADQHPQLGLVLAGPVTDPAYAEKLTAAVAASPCAQRIRILPACAPDSDALRDLYGALDCFVLPSRHEPFGIVVLEAWAAGKPVIASQVGGLQHLVQHQKNGLHFAPGQAESLQAAMAEMLDSAALRQATLAQAQHEIHTKYTWEKIAQQLEGIYQRVEQNYP